jgi:hypothetical protein
MLLSLASSSAVNAAARGCARRGMATTTSLLSHHLSLGGGESFYTSKSTTTTRTGTIIPPTITARGVSSSLHNTVNNRSGTSTSVRFVSNESTHSLKEPSNRVADVSPIDEELPGSRAFVECDRNALIDLFHKYAVDCDIDGRYLDLEGLRKLLRAVGENLDQATLERLFETADINGDGSIELDVRL